MTYYSRRRWGARPSRGGTKLERAAVRGFVLHWPGDNVRRTTVEAVKQALRAWQTDHMDNPSKQWSDIAYQVIVDQAGNAYTGRGLPWRSAANGDGPTNREYVAILLVLAIGEEPSDAMIRTTRRIIAKGRRRYPNATAVKPHSAVRPHGTECPGDKVRALIAAGAFGGTR